MATPYRTDHVGSLLRPKKLLDARRAFDKGLTSREQLREIEDQSIEDVVAMQRAAGIEVVSDGEFRRASWMGGPYDALDGLALRTTSVFAQQRLWKGVGEEEANAELPIPFAYCTQKISLKRRITGEETGFLKDHAQGPYKITMPGPTMFLSLFEPGVTDSVYRDSADMLNDLVKAYQSEVDAQIADGAAYVQLDSLRYAQALSGFSGATLDQDLKNVDAVVHQTIAADNAVLARAKGKNVTRAVHICRGNHRSAWVMSGGYDAIAERLFNELDVDRFLLEYDDERSGSFEPLRYLPKGKVAVLGLVSSKLATLESQDDLMRRIDAAARYAPLDQLALSPQCGFASTELGNLLTEDDEKRKLELIVETARRVWN